MSWQDYVNSYLLNDTEGNTGVAEHGAIIGNQDGAVWASSPNFQLLNGSVSVEKSDGSGTEEVQVNEYEHLKDAFENKGNTQKKGGIRINGEKYFMVSFDEDRNVMYLKKNGGGAAVAKSTLGYVIGTFANNKKMKNTKQAELPQNPGSLNKAVEALQTFLVDNNL